MEWKVYTKGRLITEHPEGFLIIKPADYTPAKDVFCTVCDRVMGGSLDEEALKKFGCCDSCATFWAYPNKDRWGEGWRPTSDEVINKYKISNT